jgi:hypothetical protein
VQQLVATALVGGEPLRLLGGGHERVVADIGDVPFELLELLIVARGAVDAEQVGLVMTVALDDRNDCLAGQVAREQRNIGLVEIPGDRVDELPPRLLGGVEVAGDVDPGGDGRPFGS